MNRAAYEALMLAWLVGRPQAFGMVHDGEADSALGVLHRSVHPVYGCPALDSAKERRVYSLYSNCLDLISWTFDFERVCLRCLCCALAKTSGNELWLLQHYNDHHAWSFEEIATALY